MDLFKKFLSINKKYNLIEENDKIVLGFSGGPDSVFLAEMLLKLRKDMNIDFCLVHINHSLRGDMADEDEKFSCDYAKKNFLEIFHKKIDIKKIAKEKKKTLEEVGREERYRYFEEIYQKFKATKIATAHNKDDQIETFLFKLIRGTSLEGLEGIKSKKSNVIRPISEIYKSDILLYLDNNNISYRIDNTNFENEFTRNSIRLDLIPFIENRYNNKFKDKIYSLIEEIRENNSNYNISLADFVDNGKIRIDSLLNLSSFYIRKILGLYLYEKNIYVSRKKIEEIEKILFKTGMKKIDLSKKFELVKDYDFIFLKEKIVNFKEDLEELSLKIPASFYFGEYKIDIRKVNENEELKSNKNNVFFYLPENAKIEIRTKKDGDRIKLSGMEASKKIKDIFINDKVTKDKRDRIPIILYEEQIIWAVGIRKGDFFLKKDSENTQKFLFSVEEVNN